MTALIALAGFAAFSALLMLSIWWTHKPYKPPERSGKHEDSRD